MIKAAMTPGTHPAQVSNPVIIIDPHPLSMTASGGNMIDRKTLSRLIIMVVFTITNDCKGVSSFK